MRHSKRPARATQREELIAQQRSDLVIDRRPRFKGIEAGRGIAAILVTAYHGSRLVAQQRYAGVSPGFGIFGSCNAGVDFFFVVSGFLITWVHWKDVGKSGRLMHYAQRRITRIYPAYWVAMTPMLIARTLHLGRTAPNPPGLIAIASSVFLLPSVAAPVLGVAWTLVFEMFFYALFGIVIVFGWRAMFGIGFWACGIVLYNNLSLHQSFPASFLLNPFNLEFLLGIGVASILHKMRVPAPCLLAKSGAAMFLLLIIFRVDKITNGNDLALRAMFGIAASSFILGVAELERSTEMTVPAWLTTLGAASYSIYLIHSIVEPLALVVTWPLIAGSSPTVVTIVLAGLGTGAGLLFHQFVENPIMRLMRRTLARRCPVTA